MNSITYKALPFIWKREVFGNILKYYATTMITSENNIKMHFFDYINRFIFRIIRTHKEELDGKRKRVQGSL
jgi:hypothetical protein